MHIKKGDKVIVIAGKDKGKEGVVAKAMPRESRVVIDGINMVKRHEKPRKANQKGQVVSRPSPLHISNVMLLDPKTGKRTRVGSGVGKKGRVRVTKKSGTEL